MASYREIVTKTVLGKAKKDFINHYSLTPEEKPTTILGCWVINHKFEGFKENNKVRIKGSSDVNIWYSYDNDTKTLVSKQTITYNELLNVSKKIESDLNNNSEIIVRSLKDPSCTKVEIKEGNIEYDIEKELGIEVVGDSKVRIAIDDNEDEWEDLTEDKEEKVMNEIDKNVKESFIDEKSL
jgi:spore coat protein E